MQKVSSFFDTRRVSGIVAATVLSFLLVAGFTYGVTTISTNISTAGTLSVTGASTLTGNVTTDGNTILGNATSSDFITTNAVFASGLLASSTLQVTGAVRAYGALTVDGAVTLGDAVTDNITITGNATTSNALYVTKTLDVGSNASTTNIRVGGFDGANGLVAGVLHGTCDLTGAVVSASTTKNFYCSNATGVRAGDKVFMSATSSLIVGAINEQYLAALTGAASSTVSGRIDVDIMVIMGLPGRTIAGTLNFWAVR